LGPGHPRVVTWACFKKGDVSFYHFNTHLSVMSNQIREKSTRIILSEKRKILGNGSPCILTGDFNATPDSQVMTTLKEAFPIDVYRRVNLIQSSEEGTRHGFNGNSTGDRIDWILTNIPIKPINCSIVRERMRNDRFPSDHFPVIADLVIPERAIGVR
jgi:endonuclease/exonuclease/phosphatase family metal-dependent hydrolase